MRRCCTSITQRVRHAILISGPAGSNPAGSNRSYDMENMVGDPSSSSPSVCGVLVRCGCLLLLCLVLPIVALGISNTSTVKSCLDEEVLTFLFGRMIVLKRDADLVMEGLRSVIWNARTVIEVLDKCGQLSLL